MDSYERKYLIAWLLMYGTNAYPYSSYAQDDPRHISQFKNNVFRGCTRPEWLGGSITHLRKVGYLKETLGGTEVVITQKALDELVSDSGTNYPEVDCE